MICTLREFEHHLERDDDNGERTLSAPQGHILFLNDHPTTTLNYCMYDDDGDPEYFYVGTGGHALHMAETHDWKLYKLMPIIF